jgi:hypothetical protein
VKERDDIVAVQRLYVSEPPESRTRELLLRGLKNVYRGFWRKGLVGRSVCDIGMMADTMVNTGTIDGAFASGSGIDLRRDIGSGWRCCRSGIVWCCNGRIGYRKPIESLVSFFMRIW